MSDDLYTEADLESARLEQKALRRWRGERAAATVAVTAAGLWVGGLLALGACAAPAVFRLTPAPHAGFAMGAAFASFDRIAIGCGVVMLGCEVARTLLQRGSRHGVVVRIRRYVAIVMALGAAYTGAHLTPSIQALHAQGARRDEGLDGQRLQALHTQAEVIGKGLMPLALVVIALHLYTLRSREEHEDELFPAVAPLPPGGR